MNKTSIQRSFIIGDSWLYYKIYCGPQTAETILTQVLYPIINSLTKEKVIKKWFFIRYSDPKHHLRIRFNTNSSNDITTITTRLLNDLNKMISEDLIWKVQIDTYVRELERYGKSTIEQSEALFYYESKMVLSFLCQLDEWENSEELRWLFALKATNSLLNSFSFSENQKLDLLQELKIAFANEFNFPKPIREKIKKKYRVKKRMIDEFISMAVDDNEISKIIKTKSNETRELVENILQIQKEQKLNIEFEDLIKSYIHMLMNRIFKSKNRLNEMVCYDFLHRYYLSSIAKKMHRNKS